MIDKERDISLLTSLVKAITTSVYSSQDLILKFLSREGFLLPLSRNCLRRFELRELDFGNFKEKRDDAKDLRSISFDLLESLIEAKLDYLREDIMNEVLTHFGKIF
jgi:cullin-associated NEDD8-dissociated protein 1